MGFRNYILPILSACRVQKYFQTNIDMGQLIIWSFDKILNRLIRSDFQINRHHTATDHWTTILKEKERMSQLLLER